MIQGFPEISIGIGYLIMTFILIICCLSFEKGFEKEIQSRSYDDQGYETRDLPVYLRRDLEGTAIQQHSLRGFASEPMSIQKRPIPGVARSLAPARPQTKAELQSVKALRGGEFIGNRMRFKVKVLNDSQYTITDVKVFLISYPTESLKLASERDDVFYTKIEPKGFRSPTFDFLPTHDCVQGEISAGVSYIDMKGEPHTLATKPFIIRSVCDLLLPDQVSPKEFELRLKELQCGEIVVKVTDWTPQEMYEKALRIVQDANFYEVNSDMKITDGIVHALINGLAKGKYTGKSVAIILRITGPSEKRGASCKIQVSGEDQAMILPAIDDLRERLSAWLCPMCSSPLTIVNVEDLKSGKVITCPFCNVSIGR